MTALRGEAPVRRDLLWFAFAAGALGTSYALLPLYSSNQNHHFLIGLARAGEGWLAGDWMARTTDPFPVFTLFVTAVHRYLTDSVHYIVYYALFGAYAYGLMRIAEQTFQPSVVERLMFLAAICILHNEAIGYLIGIDLRHMPWWQLTHWGVAEQEIFGHGAFQASSFGMLLPLAVAWFLAGRPFAATALAGSVLLVHVSYVLTVGALTAAFMFLEMRRSHRASRAWMIGAIALACALPVAIDVAVRFSPTSTAASSTAAAMLVQHLPQETVVSDWFGWKVATQLALVAAALIVAFGTDLFVILLALFVAGAALTAVQVVTASPRLALMFPWRVSVLLVPISTAVLVRRGIIYLLMRSGGSVPMRRVLTGASAAAIALSVLIGAGRMAIHFAYFYDNRPLTAVFDRVVPARWRGDFTRALESDALPMMRFVRRTAQRDDLYVVPPELERFRLTTGAAALVDRKSHPYKDLEVIEWRRRLDLVMKWYASNDCAVLDDIRSAYSATHVVARARTPVQTCRPWLRVYEDSAYVVSRIGGEPDATMKPFP